MSNVRTEHRKFHIIYKTTCLVTGKWYIGMHSTDSLDDGYMGSGTIISRSLKKYGKSNHTIEVLEHLSDRQALILREEEILCKELRNDPLCMNIRSGGTGHRPGRVMPEETKIKMSKSLRKMWVELKKTGYKHPKPSRETIDKRAASNRGKTRSEETKMLMREAAARYLSTVTPEKRALEHEARSKAKRHTWIVETESQEIIVDNIKKFAKDHSISVSTLHNTRISGKFCRGFRIIGKAA